MHSFALPLWCYKKLNIKASKCRNCNEQKQNYLKGSGLRKGNAQRRNASRTKKARTSKKMSPQFVEKGFFRKYPSRTKYVWFYRPSCSAWKSRESKLAAKVPETSRDSDTGQLFVATARGALAELLHFLRKRRTDFWTGRDVGKVVKKALRASLEGITTPVMSVLPKESHPDKEKRYRSLVLVIVWVQTGEEL